MCDHDAMTRERLTRMNMVGKYSRVIMILRYSIERQQINYLQRVDRPYKRKLSQSKLWELDVLGIRVFASYLPRTFMATSSMCSYCNLEDLASTQNH